MPKRRTFVEIDWERVELARLRGKLGTMRPGDQELCENAFRADPKRYDEISKRVLAKIDKDMKERGF
jgi:hypothetical protein